jgi:hypothetical protein
MWINFLGKGDCFKLLQKGLISYRNAQSQPQSNNMFIDKELLQSYSDLMVLNK